MGVHLILVDFSALPIDNRGIFPAAWGSDMVEICKLQERNS
jgi:hypothetical protein